MALIKCPECQCEVSDKAAVCVGCGYPINKAAGKEYKLEIPSYTYQSSSGNYLRFVGIATWVLGGIAAVGLSLTIDRYGDVDGFNFWMFLLYAAIFFVVGLVPRCFAEFFDDVHSIKRSLQEMKLTCSGQGQDAGGNASKTPPKGYWTCKSCKAKVADYYRNCMYCGEARE